MVTEDTVVDYNGEGKWSREQINLRYNNYRKQLKIITPFNISPRIHKNTGAKKNLDLSSNV